MKPITLLVALVVNALAMMQTGSARADASAPNLIVNGDFEQATGDTPAVWQFGSANPEIFKTSIVTEPEQGRALKLTAWNNTMSGYWAQQIAVKPNTTYRVSARVKLHTGKILIYMSENAVTGGSDATRLDVRSYVETLDNQPLVPLFWKPEWIISNAPFPEGTSGPIVAIKTLAVPGEWTAISRTFQTGSLSLVALNLGAFFATGDYWFDDVSVTEVTP